MEKGNDPQGGGQGPGAGQSSAGGSGTSIADTAGGGGGTTARQPKPTCEHCGSNAVGEDGICEVCGLESEVNPHPTSNVPTHTDQGRVPWADNQVCATCGTEDPANPCKVCGERTGPRRPDKDGPRLTRTDPDGTITELFKSGTNRVAQTMNPDGSMTETVTDWKGNTTTVTHVPPSAQ